MRGCIPPSHKYFHGKVLNEAEAYTVSYLRRLVLKFSPWRPDSIRGSPFGTVVYKVALGNFFFSRVFRVCSVSSHSTNAN